MADEETKLLPSSQRKRSTLSLWRKDCCPWIPARYALAIMAFLGFCNVYALRVNLSVAIVEMDSDTVTVRNGAKVFRWTASEQGWVLASFFYGYLLTQIPGGLLAQRFGGKWVFGIGIVMTSIFTLFTPIAAYSSVWLLVIVRFLEGLFEGVTFPAMHAMWGKWAPPAERSRLGTISYSASFPGFTLRTSGARIKPLILRGKPGNEATKLLHCPYFGTIISFPLSALLCQYGFDGGWPSVFYVFGIVGIFWFFLWLVLAYNSPSSHPRISREERLYIETTIADQHIDNDKVSIPWLKIFTSRAVWAIMIAYMCNNWGLYTLLTCMPTYFRQAVPDVSFGAGGNGTNQSIVLTGVFSAIPYTLLFVVVVLGGQVADWMRKSLFSTVVVRKSFTATANLCSAAFLLLCAYFGTTTATAVPLITLSVGLGGLALSGVGVNHLDIAPKFAGILMGITNAAGTIPGIVGPQVAKAIAVQPDAPKDSAEYLNTFREEWREVFILSAEIYIFGALMYIILASGVKQPWADGVTNRTVTLTDSVSEVDVAGDNKRFGRATTIQNSKEGVNA